MFDLIFSRYTIDYLNVSAFASIQVLHRSARGKVISTLVQNPSMVISRRDGQHTIKAANPANTVTVNLRDAFIIFTDKRGNQQSFDFQG